ncbi:putative toxin-antitoxin system toxin component, PIN family [bacterium]|nr:putative toxin-antitoxin system toxin component, PIN family [bacterium]
MIRAVLDTNILVSAALSRGAPYEAVIAARAGRFEQVCSPYIIEELRRVMTDKLGFELVELERLTLAIARKSVMVPVFEASRHWCSDGADDAVVETALRGVATHLVTGDRRLLQTEVELIEIVTAQEFLQALEGG